jgi:predicted enzyme related to lactoylglutathione lyase
MNQEARDFRIDYVEFSTDEMRRTREFYEGIFGWEFTDWGPDYISFSDGRLAGGFSRGERGTGDGPLIVIYAADLAATEAAIVARGGAVVKETFSFPGGRRFHFSDPGGNVLAVWSDQSE